MNETNLKEQVRAAIQSAWPAFSQSHPNLAAVIDEELMVESASTSISDDPHYQDAMRQADAAGMAAQTIANLVENFVREWLARLG
jgi:hypothetical protein